jgi:hypothetical protein
MNVQFIIVGDALATQHIAPPIIEAELPMNRQSWILGLAPDQQRMAPPGSADPLAIVTP